MNIFQEILVDIIAFCYWLVIVFINKTLKLEIINEENWEKEERIIFALWHQATFVPFFHYRYRDIVMFVMESMRGQVLGWCARRLGYKTIVLPSDPMAYGSAKGMAKFVREIKKGFDGIIAVDGPLGPGRQVKPGLFFLARSTDTSIVPCVVKMEKYWELKSRWDRYLIPYPFSKVKIVFGEAYKPGEDDEKEVERLAEVLGRL
ncbi:MAG: DUF374 domain-containing protein [Candidatus Margulisiibacteriota bacterium]|jgi:hypothetical protein